MAGNVEYETDWLQIIYLQFFIYGFKPVLPGLSGETDKPPAMRVRVEGYTKKFPKLIE